MLTNLESRNLVFGTEEEFEERIDEFRRYMRGQIRICFLKFIRSPCKLGPCMAYLLKITANKYSKQPVATIILFSIIALFITTMVFERGLERGILALYYLMAFFASVVTLCIQRGEVAYSAKLKEQLIMEETQLLKAFDGASREYPHQSVIDDVKAKQQHLKRTLESFLESRRVKNDVPERRKASTDLHRINSFENMGFDNSAGPSSAPDPFPPLDYDTSAGPSNHSKSNRPMRKNKFRFSSHLSSSSSVSSMDAADACIITHLDGDDVYDKPPQRLFQARICVDAVKAFGLPAHVLGADSYKIFHSSSGDNSVSDDSSLRYGSSGELKIDEDAQHFEVSVEVHPYPQESLSFSNDESIPADPALIEIDENEDLSSNISYVEDQSSRSTSSTHSDDKST